MAYATTADLASFLQTTFDAAQTATAQLALDSASAGIDSATRGWRFLPVAATTVTFRGGEPTIRLQRPVTAVATVTSKSLGLVTTHAVNVGYELRGADLVWLGTYVWPTEVTVTWSRGMAAVPADVKDACLQLAALRYTNPTGEGGERIDDYVSPSRPSGEDDPARAILDAIRRAYPTARLSVPLVRA